MNEYLHYGVPIFFAACIHYWVKRPGLRAGLGISLLPLGFAFLWLLPVLHSAADADFFAIGTVILGANLYFSRELFQDQA